MGSSHMDLALSFAKNYYSKMSMCPSDIASMYTANSEMVTDEGKTVVGIESIRDVLNNKSLQERKFRLTGVSGYPTQYGSVIVLVRGTVLTRESSLIFAQTFLLARRTNADNQFYIYNDILEILGEEQPKAPAAPAPVVEPVPEPEPEPVVEPEPEEEPVPEPEPEPVQEEPVEEVKEEKAPTPVPTPPAKPAEEPEPAPKPEPTPAPAPAPVPASIGWAAIAGKAPAGKAPATKEVQVCVGGQVPGLGQALSKAEREERKEKKRGVSPSRQGNRQRGSSPQRFSKSYSIFVSNVAKETTRTDIDKLFAKYGKLTGAPTVNVEKAFAFVDFAEKKSMEDAIAASEKRQIELHGQQLRCAERTPPEKRAAQNKEANAKRAAGDKPRGMNGAAPAARRK